MLSKEDKEIIDEYYVATIEDFCSGLTVEIIEDMIYLYEEEEDYLACAGIKKALDALKEILNNKYI
jgi:hypothetical protein